MAECVWVLTRAYRFAKDRMIDVLEGLLRARELVVEDAETHYRALALYAAQPVDYADALIAEACRRAGCVEVLTLDARAASGAGMRLLR
jgi:predicted nucleic-acid-binding protein